MAGYIYTDYMQTFEERPRDTPPVTQHLKIHTHNTDLRLLTWFVWPN